ncbi:putative Glycosyl hydrolase, family 3 [Bradyrhizobium sp. ORS 375]|uniref:glycoside hydrolase family 3 N-terminal domain-containing protein n=1 Tax=Bradyrhizobium sp. (strain ORS 375) TaxID=566679 RepID=UPI0002407427|nr:glycoside hydrolase family 3 N-terminal domain-containing protein [Bradyrhizobium sp. ORS 375]CCD91373.1 putative Glycosyl hydrolase, family 3 [Bradyrhizobium sp. ORS 375]
MSLVLAFLLLSDQAGLAAGCSDTAATSRLVGPMIMAGFFGTRTSDPGFQQVMSDLEEGLSGGVVILGRNVGTRDDLVGMIDRIRSCKCAAPPFIAIDDEGGTVERLGPNIGLAATPSAAEIARGSVAAARTSYAALAAKLAALHINMNLAPVVDLNTNPANPIIGQRQRSYGNEPDTVVRYAAAFIQAHRKQGILTVLKHFPGHGSSTADSHAGIADVTTTWSPAELKPYSRLMRRGLADAIMVGHLAHERRWGGVATQNSGHAIDRLLRRELGYDGVVMTDDLAMKAILDAKPPATAAVDAVKAGADIIMFTKLSEDDQTSDVGREINGALTAAVCSGELKAGALQRSVARIQKWRSGWAQNGHKKVQRRADAMWR